MSRNALIFAAAALAMTSAAPAWAADWGVPVFDDPVFKPAYPVNYAQEDPLGFEFGLRYFYGMGSHRGTVEGLRLEGNDASHIIELHGKIDDYSTRTYLQANLGVAAIIDGTYTTPLSFGESTTTSGTIINGSADFGYLPWGDESFGVGAFAGYQYLNESMYMGRANFMTGGGGGNSEPNSLEVHGLRLGVTARAEISDMIDVRVDAAAIPYAYLTGTYGAFGVLPTAGFVQGSATQITGNLYGGAAEAMIGFRPTDNLALRAGVKGYYLTGPTEVTLSGRDPANPGNSQYFVTQGALDLFRWGPVIELTAKF